MKKIFFIIALVILIPSIGFSQSLQEENEKLKKENRMLKQYLPLKRPWVIDSYKRTLPYPITVGLLGFGNFDYILGYKNGLSGIKKDRLDSGGIGFRTKVNVNRWFAVSVDLIGDIGWEGFEFRSLVIFQRETLRSQKGFAPYGGIGFTAGNLDGAVVNVGIRYNTTQNMFVGTEVAVGLGARRGFTHYNTISNKVVQSGFTIDTKIGVEVGYRF